MCSHLNTWSQVVPPFGEVAEPSGSLRVACESSSLAPFHLFLLPDHFEETVLLSIPPPLWLIETQWSQGTINCNLCNPEPKESYHPRDLSQWQKVSRMLGDCLEEEKSRQQAKPELESWGTRTTQTGHSLTTLYSVKFRCPNTPNQLCSHDEQKIQKYRKKGVAICNKTLFSDKHKQSLWLPMGIS